MKPALSVAERGLIQLLRSPIATHRRIVVSVVGTHWTVHVKHLDDRQGNGKSLAEAWKNASRPTTDPKE